MRIKVIASVAGVVTHNGMIYAPSKLRAAASRWTDTYPRPLIMHHDTDSRPVARAISARYVDYSMEPPKGSKKDSTIVIDHSSFTDATKEQKGMLDLLKQPWVADQRKNPGLGHLEVTFDVLDESFEQDVKKGLWISGSMGFDTDAIICPCCMKNWCNEYCDHYPGETYDGILCAPMSGNMYPQEWSVCNVPAIEASKISEIIEDEEENEMKDIAQMTKEELLPYQAHIQNQLGMVPAEDLQVAQAQLAQLREELRVSDSKGTAAIRDFRKDLLAKLGIADSDDEGLDLAVAIKDAFPQALPPTPAPLPPFKKDSSGTMQSNLREQLQDAYANGRYDEAAEISKQIRKLAEEGKSL